MSDIEKKYENARSIIKSFIKHGVLTGQSGEERYCTIWDAALEAQYIITSDEWISVDERLPKLRSFGKSQTVLVYCPTREYPLGAIMEMETGRWRRQETGKYIDFEITDWMPTPKPPAK